MRGKGKFCLWAENISPINTCQHSIETQFLHQATECNTRKPSRFIENASFRKGLLNSILFQWSVHELDTSRKWNAKTLQSTASHTHHSPFSRGCLFENYIHSLTMSMPLHVQNSPVHTKLSSHELGRQMQVLEGRDQSRPGAKPCVFGSWKQWNGKNQGSPPPFRVANYWPISYFQNNKKFYIFNGFFWKPYHFEGL